MPLSSHAEVTSDVDQNTLGGGSARSKARYEHILLRNIFDSDNTINQKTADPISYEPPPVPTLDLNSPPILSDMEALLLGTMLRSDAKQSTATIDLGAGVVKRFKVGDRIQGEAEIIDIQRKKVVMIRNYHREYLEIGKKPASFVPTASPVYAAPSAAASGTNVQINKDQFQDALSRVDEILYDAASVPNVVDGKIEGFKILYINPGSIYEQLNIQDGDIILKVNGNAINSIETALNLFNTLKTETTFNIEVKRDGALINNSYSIK